MAMVPLSPRSGTSSSGDGSSTTDAATGPAAELNAEYSAASATAAAAATNTTSPSRKRQLHSNDDIGNDGSAPLNQEEYQVRSTLMLPSSSSSSPSTPISKKCASSSTTARCITQCQSNNNNNNAYRLHFSCHHIGKYRTSTKRRIEWKFGFTNLQAAREGKRGVDCRGEEHEIQLIWSVLSGKIRVYWNKSDITHLFRDQRQERREQVDISWEARSGATFRVLARGDNLETDNRDVRQYDLLVDGTSFFSFSHISDLTFALPSTTLKAMGEMSAPLMNDLKGDSEHKFEERSDNVSSLDNEMDDTYHGLRHHSQADDLGLRLSMAGFTPPEQTDEFLTDDLVDDLTSTSLNNVLESLRGLVIESIPRSDGMVSKALVLALSEETSESYHSDRSCGSGSSSFDSAPPPSCIATKLEADVLNDTVEWISYNVRYAPRPDVEDQKLSFLQRQMDSVFIYTKQERLSVESAGRVLCDVATLLNLELTVEVPKDTVLLNNFEKTADTETLIDCLCSYGDLKDVGIASGRRFAVCRFASETGPLRISSAVHNGTFNILGHTPCVDLIKRPVTPSRPNIISRRAASTPSLPIPKPNLHRRRSHQRNTITIDTLISQTPHILEVVNNEMSMVSPLRSSTSPSNPYDVSVTRGEGNVSPLNPLVSTVDNKSGTGPLIPLVSPTSETSSPIRTSSNELQSELFDLPFRK